MNRGIRETARIRIRVDPFNPGQFLACCGLLEIADRLWPGAEGWFETQYFELATHGSLDGILDALLQKLPEELTKVSNGLTVEPLLAPLLLNLGEERRQKLILDAWMSVRVVKGKVIAASNAPWNFWSGQQTPLRIWRALRSALMEQRMALTGEGDAQLFEHRVPLPGRFGFDPGAAWDALDVGFSPNEQEMKVATSPAAELLACVGLQRFRPVLRSPVTFEYLAWRHPLGLIAASAAATGLSSAAGTRFRGVVVSRGQYAALGYSTLIGKEEG